MTTCSDFPSEAMLWIKEVEMVDSSRIKNPRDQLLDRNFQILRCQMRESLLL